MFLLILELLLYNKQLNMKYLQLLLFLSMLTAFACGPVDPCSSPEAFVKAHTTFVTSTIDKADDLSENEWKEKDDEFEKLMDKCFENLEDDLSKNEKEEIVTNSAKYLAKRVHNSIGFSLEGFASNIENVFDEDFGKSMEKIGEDLGKSMEGLGKNMEGIGKEMEDLFDEDFQNKVEEIFDEDFQRKMEDLFDDEFKSKIEDIFDDEFKEDLKKTFEDLGKNLEGIGEKLKEALEEAVEK